MKKIILFAFLFNLNFLNAQTLSSCNVPQQLADGYYRDIRQLAAFNMFQMLSQDTALVHIPQSEIDPIVEGLAAILNAPIPESDSVFNLYCVHNLNGWPYEYQGYLVAVDTSYAWTQPWQNLITTTGDLLMDTIVARYNLQVTSFYNWSFGSYALLETDSAWNPHALMDTFLLVAGVISAEQNYIIGNGGTITYANNVTDRTYEFFFEFNDCFDGCDNYRKWTFKVYSDCSVDYMGFVDYGTFGLLPLPPPVNCNLFTSIQKPKVNDKFFVYPNPANEYIQLNCPVEVVNSSYVIFDITGKAVTEGKILSSTTMIDVSDLPQGVYFLKALGSENKFSATFMLTAN